LPPLPSFPTRRSSDLHIFPRGEFRGFGAPARLLPWIRETRRLQPDAALDFQGLFRSAVIARISGAKKILGMSDAREGSRFFYTRSEEHTSELQSRGHL